MKIWWYIARAGGLVSWGLLAASILWGLLLSTRLFRSRPRPAWTLDLHRFLGGFALLFTAVHVAGLVADSYVHFGPAEILVPLASRWHPVAVAWGVIALYLLLAIEGSSLLMKRLSNRAWRRIHRTSVVLFATATVHGVSAGTDVDGGKARIGAIVVSGLVLFLWLLRILTGKGSARRAAGAPRTADESTTVRRQQVVDRHAHVLGPRARRAPGAAGRMHGRGINDQSPPAPARAEGQPDRDLTRRPVGVGHDHNGVGGVHDGARIAAHE